MRRVVMAVAVAAVLLGIAGCAPADQGSSTAPGSGTASAAADRCTKEQLATRTSGKLTIGTDQPAYPPWFVDGEPSNGKGFESAVAYAVASKLGFEQTDVTWISVPFNAAIQPGTKSFDLDINQFSINDERKQAVDFSSPYYDVSQAIVAMSSSPAASATSIAALQQFKIGAQVGTTSYDAIVEQIKPNQQPGVYNTNDDAKAALANGQIQALVLDLPTAFFVTSELFGAKIVGQLPQASEQPEQFGIVLDKGSSLTSCVSAAVDALRADGALERLEQEWLSEAGAAPELR
jgi:polar amino acid transport system substrate-binding protein